jgi:hypothetical protein
LWLRGVGEGVGSLGAGERGRQGQGQSDGAC